MHDATDPVLSLTSFRADRSNERSNAPGDKLDNITKLKNVDDVFKRLPSPLRAGDTKPFEVDQEVKQLLERRNKSHMARRKDNDYTVEKEHNHLRDYAHISKFKKRISAMPDNNLDDMSLLHQKNDKFALIK